MNIKSDIAVFKGNLKTAIQMWSSDLVDEILSSPVRRRNIKRYIENWLDFQDDRINKLLDNIVLIGLDKDGNINSDLIVDEMVALFKEFDYHSAIWGCNIDISNGKAVISLPDNMVSYLLFGNKGSFSFNEQDILKLKDYIK